MKHRPYMPRTLLWLTIYAIAMAYLEAAVVVYLRELYYPENVLQIFPPKMFRPLDVIVELGREVATIVMMIAVALLAEQRNRLRQFAAFVFQFGVWDVFYYIWLKVLIGWPVSWREWDILFLIPWAWFGPWLTPVVIALLFVLWGYWLLKNEAVPVWSTIGVMGFIVGALLALLAFLQPAIPLLVAGNVEKIRQFVPEGFWWWTYIPGVVLMTWGLWRVRFVDQTKEKGNH